MADALEQLKSRLADIQSLDALAWLLDWDQRTTMPPGGGAHRADHLALVQRTRARAADRSGGRSPARRARAGGGLARPRLDRCVDDPRRTPRLRKGGPRSGRVAGGDGARLGRVGSGPGSRRRRHPTSSCSCRYSNATSSCARRYIACFEPRDEPYDILLDDFEPEMRSAEVTRIFAEIRDELVPLIAELRDRDVDDSFLTGDFPVDRQVALDYEVVDLFGHRPDTWRIDPTEHPFASGAGHRRRPDHDALLPRRAQVDLLDDARVRSRALRAPAPARVRASSRSAPLPRSRCTSRRAVCGRTWSAAACRSGASCIRACRSLPRGARRRRARALLCGHQQGAAVADPDRGGRGDVRHARDPPLRARAGHRERPRRAARPAAALG